MREITVDLRRPAEERWRLTPGQREQARELFRVYKADLGLGPEAGALVVSMANGLVRPAHWAEMESLATELALPSSDAVLCNLYYDALKAALGNLFGCTAFAVDTPEGVLHARNLDWWTEGSALSRFTAVCRFVGAPAGEFTTVGWPGFIGAFSGVAPGRFAITLNAVLSTDPVQLGTPVVLLIRTVLEEARTFEEARGILSQTPIPCDCLLLLTGTRPGEMVVIERTPGRHAMRGPRDGYVCVTNGYQVLNAEPGSAPSGLMATCCQRFERASELVRNAPPQTAEACFGYLSDPEVRMNMTVQQMVFRAATGEHWVRVPEDRG
jgi:hypothetical protein